jgi:hypothetical protein
VETVSARIVLLLIVLHQTVSTPTIEWKESVRNDPHVHVRESGSEVTNDASYRTSTVNETVLHPHVQEYGVAGLAASVPVGDIDDTDIPVENLHTEVEFSPPGVILDEADLDLSVLEKKHANRHHRHKASKTKDFHKGMQGAGSIFSKPNEGTEVDAKRNKGSVLGSSVTMSASEAPTDISNSPSPPPTTTVP